MQWLVTGGDQRKDGDDEKIQDHNWGGRAYGWRAGGVPDRDLDQLHLHGAESRNGSRKVVNGDYEPISTGHYQRSKNRTSATTTTL